MRPMAAVALASLALLARSPRSAGQQDDTLDALDGARAAPPPAMPRMLVVENYPRYFTASIEFHDPEDGLWPTYFLARPAGTNGWFEFGGEQHRGSFAIRSHMMAQADGSQDKRLAGELVRMKEVDGRDGKKEQKAFGPDVEFTLRTLGPVQVEEKTVVRRTAKGPESRVVKTDYTPVTGVLAVDGRPIQVRGNLYVSLRQEENRVLQKLEWVAAPMRMIFDVKGADLGMKQNADRTVRVCVYAEAFVPPKSVAELQADVGVPKAEETAVEAALEDFSIDP